MEEDEGGGQDHQGGDPTKAQSSAPGCLGEQFVCFMIAAPTPVKS